MKLSDLIQHLPILEKRHFSEKKVTGLAYHSGRVQPGNLFIAIPGTAVDGHDFLDMALQAGACAVVVEREVSVPKDIPVFRVENTRSSLSRLASHWYHRPSQDLNIIGITGTNGKTTISCLLQHILESAGHSTGRIGTIGFQYGGKFRKLNHTTPESPEIHGMLREMVDHGIKNVAMEVSSHAIDMHRVDDVQFNLGIFSNLTPEHLDYHMTMELYFESKKRLFTVLLPQGGGLNRSIINADDPYGQSLIEFIKDSPVWTYSTKAQSKWDFFVQDWHSDLQGLQGTLSTPSGTSKFRSNLIGAFNLSNILASIAAALSMEIPLKTILGAIDSFGDVPGRLERVPNSKGLYVFVDYAHTPDALKNVLQALRDLDPQRIITLFGCGGDRDRTKRPIMGREVARLSDLAIVTSDNPRTEDPQGIIDEILPGIKEGNMKIGINCLVEPDRKKAITLALDQAKKGDVVLVAGKGHEDYQILGTKRIHFDDREVAEKILNSN